MKSACPTTVSAGGEKTISVSASQVSGAPNRIMRWSPGSQMKTLLPEVKTPSADPVCEPWGVNDATLYELGKEVLGWSCCGTGGAPRTLEAGTPVERTGKYSARARKS